MGVAFSSCIVPAAGTTDIQRSATTKWKLGVGIHGEPGRRRARLATADAICDELLETIVEDLDPATGAELLVLANGLGGTPLGELYLLFNSARQCARGKGLRVARSLIGNVTTSLDMAGASLDAVRAR